jgi:diguanylate cyclase (GGDEF)-like protein
VTVAYPMMDVAVLFIVVRGLFFGGSRSAAHKWLAASLLSMLVGDFIYDLLVQHGAYVIGNPVDASWLVSYVLLAGAALHSSVAAAPVDVGVAVERERRRLPVVAVAALVAPAITLTSELLHKPVDVAVMAGLSLALFSLVVLRMRWLFSRLTGQARALEGALSARGLLEADLRFQAFHDGLTGLANRALLNDRVTHALAGSGRASGIVALCFCDLDGFKTVNDSFGHVIGDEVLIAVAQRLCSIVRAGDTVARLGGDEFAVLMENVEHPDDAAVVAERIVAALRKPISASGHEVALSASVGVAISDAGMSTERLLSEGDSAMYSAKAAGKDRFTVFEHTMRERILRHLALKNGLSEAVTRSEFFLEYQPQFSLRDGGLIGFEALLRWRHPTLGLVPPNEFVPIAEESGHIVPIGRWVLETACEQAALWRREFSTQPQMAIKVSGRQLQSAGFVDDVGTALAVSGLDSESLVVEITEGVLVIENEVTVQARERLRASGVRLGVEGYSTLNHLRRYPVDVVKIDRSFVGGMVGDEPTEAIISAILTVGRSLGFAVVAAGVETEEQAAELRRLGCELAQGFYFSKALRAEDCLAFLSASRHVQPNA